MKMNFKNKQKRIPSVVVALLFSCSMLVAMIPSNIIDGYAIEITPSEINDLGYLGNAVNLLREIDTTNGSDNILSKGKLKTVLKSDVSDFTVKKDVDGTSKGQGYTSSSFASLALEMGVDLSTKASSSSDFMIGSAKLECSFAMKMNSSISASSNVVYETYTYQKYLDTWTLNWDNEGVKGNVSKIRDDLQANVYGALANTLPQSEWTPEDFFEEYGTHIIVSYQRGGEYTYSSIEIDENYDSKISIETEIAASASGKVSSFGEGGFESKVDAKETVEVDTGNTEKKVSIFSRGSSKTIGKNDLTDTDKINEWLEGVDDANAQILANNYVELVAVWDLLPNTYASRKAELKNYYNEQVAKKCDNLLSKFVYKEVNESAFDYTGYSVIYNANDLNNIRNNLNGKYVLANDIDLSDMDWIPIGMLDAPFRGVFDGNGNTINGLNIVSTSRTGVGLFGANNGTIKNVSVNGDISIEQQNDLSYVGGIVGYNNGYIENCQNEVNINTKLSIYKDDNSVNTLGEEINLMGANGSFEFAKILKPTSINELRKISDSFIYSTSNPFREFIIDLRELDGTSLDTTISVPSSMYALKIIGNVETTYTGLNIVVSPSSQESCKLSDGKTTYFYLTLENMHFTSIASDGAITVNGRSLIIDSQGNSNSIQDNRTVDNINNNIFAISLLTTSIGKTTLYIVGVADLTVSGAKGQNGQQGDPGENGTDRGHGWKTSGGNGLYGADGTDGKKGGSALYAEKLSVDISGVVTLIGGDGGVGGDGGEGGTGGKGANGDAGQYSGGAGGTGGIGGTGGSGGDGGASIYYEIIEIYSGTCILQSGKGGKGGAGGDGGKGGNGGNVAGVTGVGGKGGDGGEGGTGGKGGNIGYTDIHEVQLYNDSKLFMVNPGEGLGGDGGTGGTPGSYGSKGSWWGAKNGQSGSYGADGNDGKNGEVNVYKYTLYTFTSEYVLIDEEKSWVETKEFLQAQDQIYNLVSIRSEEEQAIVLELIGLYDPDYSNQYWIGCERNDKGTDSIKGDNTWCWLDEPNNVFTDEDADGVYTYSDGRIAVTFFNEGEPNDGGNTGARENYLQISSNGNWSDASGDTLAYFIMEKARGNSDNQIGVNSLIVGGIAGYNSVNAVVTNCWSHENIVAEVCSTTRAVGVVSGLVGANEGKVLDSYADGVQMKLIVNSTSTSEFADGYLSKFTYNIGEGECLNCQYGVMEDDKESNNKVLLVTASSMATTKKNEFDGTADNISIDSDELPQHVISLMEMWAEDRVHVASIGRTEFVVGEILNEYIVSLTYVDINDASSRKISKSYSYKYDFRKEGITCINLTYNYNGNDQKKYIPVNVVGSVVVGYNISAGNDLKTYYSYGEAFENPVVIKTMSDGSEYIITPETDNNLKISTNINTRVPGQYIVTVEYLGFEPIEYTVTVELTESDPQITVSSKSVCAGSTVQLNVSIKNNPGIMNAVLTLAYDSEILTLVDVENGAAFSNSIFTAPGQFVPGCNFVWDGIDVNNFHDGIILTLTFEVSENVCVGESYFVGVSYVQEDLSNSDLNLVDVAVVNGTVTIIDYTPGDVNGDGRINGTDITLIRRFIAGGYDVDIIEEAADINGDGRINGTDVTLIRRYIAGGYDVELN